MESITDNKRLKFIINIAFYAVCLTLSYFVLKYIPGLFMPFIFALLIVLITNPLVNLVVKKLKIPRRISGPVIVILAIALLLGLVYFLFAVVLGEMTDLIKEVANDLKALPQKIEQFSGAYDSFLDRISVPAAIKEAFDFNNLVANIATSLTQTLDIQNIVSVAVSNTSEFVLGFFIMIVATVLLSADYPRVRNFLMRQFSPKLQKTVMNVKVFMKTTVWGYTKTYSIIFAFYFVSMFLLFLVLGVPHAAMISFLIALVDLLPVLGLGLVLIPWSIICFISGNVWFGVALIVAYIILTFVRNLIEPKLIGKQVGIHPLTALLAIYLGLELFGVIGVFVLPLAIIMLKSEHDAGRLHLWK